jgi:Zn-dependent protease/CBS domain-containing protein
MGSLSLGKIAGIDIRIHWSWLVIFFLLVWSLSEGFYKDIVDEDWSRSTRWVAGTITTFLFFLSVLLHELSHSLVAKRLGLPVSSITLFIFGGVSALTDEPRSAGDEFKIAIVGPLTSFALGILSGAIFIAIALGGQSESVPGVMSAYLAFINVVLGVFNMLPGYPLDGGRVLRAGLWAKSRNMIKATRWAATAGTVLSYGLIGFGVISALAGGIMGGIWMIVIGWFLRNTSEQAYQQLLLRNTLEGRRVSEILNTGFESAPPDISAAQLVNDYILRRSQRCVPIVVADELLGIVTMTDLRRIPPEEWPTTSAFRAMTPREKLHSVSPEDDLTAVLQAMTEHEIHQIPVLERGRDFLGFVTRADLLRLIQIRSELGSSAQAPGA